MSKVGEIIQHTGDVVQGLQSFTRRGERQVEPLSLEDVVRDAVLLTESEWRQRRVAIGVDVEEDVPLIAGDTVQLQQVVVNLLLNSCEALVAVPAEERRIDVRICSRDEHVEVEIADNECGVTDEQADRLFETFYSTKEDGLGMGMSISRRIVEDHQGTLEYVPGESTGAAFLIRVPHLAEDETGRVHDGTNSLSD